MPGPSVVWFRDDLRVGDHPALHAAVERGEPIVAVYVLDEESPGIRPLGFDEEAEPGHTVGGRLEHHTPIEGGGAMAQLEWLGVQPFAQ